MSHKNTSGLSVGYTAPKKTTSTNNIFRFRSNIQRSLDNLETSKVVKRLKAGGDIKKDTIEVVVPDEERTEIYNLAKSFLAEFDDYIVNGDYNQTEAERLLVDMKMRGLTNKVVMERLNLKAESSLRTKYARLSKKVYEHLFNQSSPILGVELLDLKALRKAEACIRTATFHFELSDVFSYEFANQIEKIVSDPSITRGTYSDAEADDVIHFLALYSSEVFKDNLRRLNRSALLGVVEALSKQELSSTIIYAYKYKVLIARSLDLLNDSRADVLHQAESCSETFDLARKAIKNANDETAFELSEADYKNASTTEVQQKVETYEEPIIVEDEVAEPAQTSSGVAFNLPISKEVSDEFVQAIERYKAYQQKCIDGGKSVKYADSANPETRKKAEAFFKSLITENSKSVEQVLAQVKELNPYDFVYLLEHDYKR